MLAVAPNQTKIYYGFNAMLKELIYFPITKHQAMNLPISNFSMLAQSLSFTVWF